MKRRVLTWTLLPFAAAAEKSIAGVSAELDRQTAINEALNQKLKDLDPMAKQQAMMDYMMQHPQDAQKFMQGINAATPQMMPALQAESAQDEEFAGLMGQYREARSSIHKTTTFIGKPTVTEGGDIWSISETASLNKRIDEKYEQLCMQWFKGGKFDHHLAVYKKVLVDDLPRRDQAAQLQKDQLAMFSVPVDTYRSTAAMEAVKKYLLRAQSVFGARAETHSHVDKAGLGTSDGP